MGRAASQCDSLMTGFTQHDWLPLQRAPRERGEATREKGREGKPSASEGLGPEVGTVRLQTPPLIGRNVWPP